jgi:hypothetical protein
MRQFSSRSIAAVIALGLTFLIGGRLTAQPVGGPPPPPVFVWTMTVPNDNQLIPAANNVPASGDAALNNKAYLVTVYYDGGFQSAAGTSDGQNSWSITVNPPAGGWGVGVQTPNGEVVLYVDGLSEASKSLNFF